MSIDDITPSTGRGRLLAAAALLTLAALGLGLWLALRPEGAAAGTQGQVSGYAGASVQVSVQAGGTTTVTFANKEKDRTRKLEVCKTVEGNGDGVEDGGQFTFTYDDGSGPKSITLDVKEGETECKTVEVLQGKDVTVSETNRPGEGRNSGRWNGDAPGYPNYQVGSGSWQEGSSAAVPAGKNDVKVTFKNKTNQHRVIEVCKLVEANDDGNNDSGGFTFDLFVDGQSQPFTWVTITVTEGARDPSCEKVNLTDFNLPATTDVVVTERPVRPSNWTSDANGYPKYQVDSGSWSAGSTADLGTTGKKVTFANKDDRKQTVTFVKVICPTYKDVPANQNPTTYDQTGGHAHELDTSYQTSLTNPATDIPSGCRRAEGWSFTLYKTWSLNNGDPVGVNPIRTVGPTDQNGEVVVALTPEEIDEARSGDGLWVSEVTQPGYGFAALRCYDDILNGDNLEFIKLSSIPTDGVYCIAYNVKLEGRIVVKKVVTNDPQDSHSFTATVGQQSQPFSQGSPATFTVPSGEHTVTESDEAGYGELGWALAGPDGKCPESPSGNGDDPRTATVEVGPGGTVTVCFYNVRHGEVTVTKSNDVNGTTTPGGSFTWTITVTVSGGPLGQQLQVSDPLPSALTYGTPTYSPSGWCSDTNTADGISCTLSAGSPAGTYTISIPVTVPATFEVCGQHVNRGGFTLGESGDGRFEDTVTVQCVAGSGTIIVKKVVTNAPGDTTSFTASISGVGTGSFSQAAPLVQTGLAAGTYVVAEVNQAGYAYLGYALIAGEGSCPQSIAPGNNVSVTVTTAQPIWTVCFYNEKMPEVRGVIYVKKVIVDGQNLPIADGTLFTVDITPGVANNVAFGQAVVYVASGLNFGSYTVHEDPKAGYTYLGYRVQPGNATCRVEVVGLSGGDATVALSQQSPAATVCFFNRRLETPPSTPTEPPRTLTPVIPKTPTPTPSPTPSPTPTSTPTPTPTETVAGEATPGPTATPTPRPPAAGTGTGGPQGSPLPPLLLLGLAAVTAGAGLLVLGRRRA